MTTYAIAPPGKPTIAMLALILGAWVIGVSIAIAGKAAQSDLLGTAQSLMLAILPVAILVPAFLRREVRVDDGVLTVKAALHTRNTPISDLDLDAAQIVDLRDGWRLRPLLRTFGFGLIGYRAGHFWTLGRKRVFALVTRFDRVLVLPERNGKLILVSVERPERLLEQLRAA